MNGILPAYTASGGINLTNAYDLMMAGEKLGCVMVSEEGLYHHISCRCHISGEVMMQLVLHNIEGDQTIGLLVPMDGQFGLEKRIAKKRMGQGTFTFVLRPRHDRVDDRFVPIRPEEPFAYLKHLEHAVFAVRNGQAGLRLKHEK